MKKRPMLFLFFVVHLTASASSDSTRYGHNTWIVDYKILPWSPIVLPFWGINYTLGLEYGFSSKNSIGAEFVYNDNGSHNEYPSSNGQDSAGPNAYAVSRSILVHYKRFLVPWTDLVSRSLNHIFRSRYVPYLSVFTRYSWSDDHFDSNFETTEVSRNMWQYSVGCLFGVMSQYADINIGPFYKQSYTSEVDKVNGIDVLSHSMKPNFGLRIGVNLFYVLKRKSDHLLVTNGI